MLENFLDKGKCRVGLHAGEWVYVSAGACQLERVCPRCATKSQQVVHAWEDWASSVGTPCDLGRGCVRCGDRETKVEHEWAAPAYVAEGSCAQVRPCVHCGVTEPAATVHVWDAWAYVREDDCEQVAACSRCGQQGQGSHVAHDWDAWQTSAFYRARVCVCRHCAETVLNLDERDDLETGVSFQATQRALWRCMAAPDVPSTRERIAAEADLVLTPGGQRCLEFLTEQVVTDEGERGALRRFAELLDRCRVEGFDTGSETLTSTDTADESALLGHWLSTQVVGDGGDTTAIDTHMDLTDDGRFRWFVRSASGSGETVSDTFVGSWAHSEDVLSLSFDGGTELTWRFVMEDDRMVFPDDSRFGFWDRIGDGR